jgi:hypothetical protein
VSAPPQPKYVQTTIREATDTGFPGEIAEGWFTIEDWQVVVRDSLDRHIGSRALRQGQDAADIARQFLRETTAGSDFNRPLRYLPLGLA